MISLVENQAVRLFYVGNQGNYDAMVQRELYKMEKTHGIQYYIVLAYLPKKDDPLVKDTHTLFPEGIETVPPRFAINKRNRWMLEHSQYVITYVRNDVGGAARCKQYAERKGKRVIEL